MDKKFEKKSLLFLFLILFYGLGINCNSDSTPTNPDDKKGLCRDEGLSCDDDKQCCSNICNGICGKCW